MEDPIVLSDEEIVEDNINVVDKQPSGGDGKMVPVVGMIFNDDNELLDFYKKYVYAIGFSVKRRNSKKGDDGVVRYVTLTCSREGRRDSTTSITVKSQPTSQTDCKARISTSMDNIGKWRIKTVHLEHNHKTSPSKSRLFRCNRALTTNARRKLELNDMTGIPLHKSYNSAVVEASGYENLTFVERDCQNYIEQVRRLKLGEGDAIAIQSYFSKMQARCSGFYFRWTWMKSHSLRIYFGQIIGLGKRTKSLVMLLPLTPRILQISMICLSPLLSELTTMDNQYYLAAVCCRMRKQTHLCGYLGHGSSACMVHGIIINQDRSMKNAIQIVFPTTKHRWYLWHIMKKLSEKFGYHVDKGSIFSAIHGLVYDSQIIDQFEEGWTAMVGRFDLHANGLLSGLYDNISRWVPCFLKTTFWAEMSTMQRSESMNAFFDGYVHSKTSLKQFIEQYERVLKNKVEKEF